jgi:hypothetical protein
MLGHDRGSERFKPSGRGLSGNSTASYATIFHRDEADCALHFQCNIASILTEDLWDYLNVMRISPVALTITGS